MDGDGGKAWVRLSRRDGEVLGFVARFGVVPRDAVAAWAGTGRSTTAARERRLREAGLLEVARPLPGEPFLKATRLGLDACGRDDLFPARVAPVRLAHFAAVAHLVVKLEAEGRALLSERELLAHERAMGERVFSVALADGSHHRPDLILLPPGHPLSRSSPLAPVAHDRTGQKGSDHAAGSAPAPHARTRPRGGSDPSENSGCQEREGSEAEALMSGRRDISGDAERASGGAEDVRVDPEDMRVGAVEVELSTKGSERLDAIVDAYREAVEAGRFSSVRYLCSEEALPSVRRSVDRTGSGAAVVVGPLPPALP